MMIAGEIRARGEVPDLGNLGWLMVHAATLERIAHTAEALTITAATDCDFAFIGIGGKQLARSHGRCAAFALAAARGGYVRAVVTDASGKQAWVQPVRVPE